MPPETADILADYRQWPRHERCMIQRLAAEVERLRQVLVQKNVTPGCKDRGSPS